MNDICPYCSNTEFIFNEDKMTIECESCGHALRKARPNDRVIIDGEVDEKPCLVSEIVGGD